MRMHIGALRAIEIGREKDGGVSEVRIDVSEWRALYPQLTAYRIEATSPAGVRYLPVTAMEGSELVWAITTGDTTAAGRGCYQVVATGEQGERKTSASAHLIVPGIMPGTAQDEPPEAAQAWTQTVVDAAKRAEEAAEEAREAAESFDGAAADVVHVGSDEPEGGEQIWINPDGLASGLTPGALLYVGADNVLQYLRLGEGLGIVDGALTVTGTVTPETEIVFEAADGGVVTMSGAEFTALDGGAVQIDAALTDQGGGVVLVS